MVNLSLLTWTEFGGNKPLLKIMESKIGALIRSKTNSIAEAAAYSDFPFFLDKDKGIFVSWNTKTEGYRLIPVYCSS
jgi:hypothetical protein